jgi:hypothetical protein
MFNNILTEKQKEILPHFESITKDYYMVGGTAIALQIGHRRSIDFDLFTMNRIKRKNIHKWLNELTFVEKKVIFDNQEQIHMILDGVKITFYSFPFKIKLTKHYYGIPFPSVLSLAAMKAFAIGKRAKWKDYVDLYFIMKDHFSIKQIIKEAEDIFSDRFNGRQFRQQLGYFNDIDYDETVEYCVNPIPEERIKHFLTHVSTDPF